MSTQFDLAGLRRSAGRTQAEVAVLVGIPRHRVGRLEAGVGSLETFAAVVTALGGTLPDLRTIRLRAGMSSRTLAQELGTTHSVVSVMEHEGRGSVATWHRAIGILGTGYTRLTVKPCELAEANDLVARWHRHHAPAVGHRFSLKVIDERGDVRGAVIVGRPVARNNDQRLWLEVVRCVTDTTPNACSALYLRAAARVGREMGFEKILTYTLEEESGTSLRAVGWTCEGVAGGGDWNVPSRGGRRVDQPMGMKQRWAKNLA